MSKIKVYVRTRPTDSFAKDMLFFNQDNKVREAARTGTQLDVPPPPPPPCLPAS